MRRVAVALCSVLPQLRDRSNRADDRGWQPRTENRYRTVGSGPKALKLSLFIHRGSEVGSRPKVPKATDDFLTSLRQDERTEGGTRARTVARMEAP
jgi:hypothetical protein